MAFTSSPEMKHRCKNPGVIALTFDDGLTKKSNRILDILDDKNVKASFFVIGETLPNQTNFTTLRRINSRGHTIGNHSWSHPFLTKISESKFKHEILETQNGINLVTNTRYFRPPFGSLNQHIKDELTKLGFTTILWNFDLKDWSNHKSIEKEWFSYIKVIEKADILKDSYILILHEKENTIKLLPKFIDFALDKRFRFVTIEECVSTTFP